MLILVAVSVLLVIDSNLIGKTREAAESTTNEYRAEANYGEKFTVGSTEYNNIDEYIAVLNGGANPEEPTYPDDWVIAWAFNGTTWSNPYAHDPLLFEGKNYFPNIDHDYDIDYENDGLGDGAIVLLYEDETGGEGAYSVLVTGSGPVYLDWMEESNHAGRSLLRGSYHIDLADWDESFSFKEDFLDNLTSVEFGEGITEIGLFHNLGESEIDLNGCLVRCETLILSSSTCTVVHDGVFDQSTFSKLVIGEEFGAVFEKDVWTSDWYDEPCSLTFFLSSAWDDNVEIEGNWEILETPTWDTAKVSINGQEVLFKKYD